MCHVPSLPRIPISPSVMTSQYFSNLSLWGGFSFVQNVQKTLLLLTLSNVVTHINSSPKQQTATYISRAHKVRPRCPAYPSHSVITASPRSNRRHLTGVWELRLRFFQPSACGIVYRFLYSRKLFCLVQHNLCSFVAKLRYVCE